MNSLKNIASKLKRITDNNEIYLLYKELGLLFKGFCPLCKTKLRIERIYYTNQGTEEAYYFCQYHHREFSNRFGTIFSKMKMSYNAFNKVLLYYSLGFSDHDIKKILEVHNDTQVSYKTLKKYLRRVRSVIHIYVQKTLLNLTLEGPVEIDETCLYRLKKGRNGRIAKISYWGVWYSVQENEETSDIPGPIQNKSCSDSFNFVTCSTGSYDL